MKGDPSKNGNSKTEKEKSPCNPGVTLKIGASQESRVSSKLSLATVRGVERSVIRVDHFSDADRVDTPTVCKPVFIPRLIGWQFGKGPE